MLQSILGDLSLDAFVAQHLHRLPYSSVGGARSLCDQLDEDSISRMLDADGEPDVLAARAGELATAAPQSSDDFRRAFAEGWTVALRHAERHDERLAAIAESFTQDFDASVDVHVYATPAAREGFGWHYDVEDVFIIVTRGRKRFQLRRNTVQPWPLLETMGEDLRIEQEISPVLDYELNAGDWIYVPNGWWHVGRSEEDAITMAIGVASPTVIDLYDALRPALLQSLMWRQRLPAQGRCAAGEDPRRMDMLLKELGRDLEQMLREHVAGQSQLVGRRAEEA